MYTDESDYSGETDDGGSTIRRMSPNTRQNFRQNVNVVVCLSAAITLIFFNFIGALVFILAEKENYENVDESENEEISKCLQNFPIGNKITLEMRKKVEKCLRKDSLIDDFGKALFFSWSLYSTVGYGNLYPHSSLGRFLAAVYSLLMIPIYIAFKFEFGTFLAHILVIISNRTRITLKIIYKKIINRFFARVLIDSDHSNSFNRDHLIFLSSILLCSISLLSSSALFSVIENISLSTSIYFGVITMTLIGLGDIVPKNIVWFSAYSIFFLVSDVLSNQIFYFCQARIRFFFHFLARRVLLLKGDDDDFELETTISLHHIPVINSQCMPSIVMDCEKDELDKDDKLISSFTSL